jgi:hypothetical protein
VEGGYRGEAINVAARLCAQAGPGEVLASEAVIHLARRVEGLTYQERGELALKGLPRPVRTWSIRAGLGEIESIEAPASATTPVATVALATSVRHNLPVAPSSFVGREHERAAVRALLAEARLVTLGEAGFVAAWAEGQVLPVDEAIALALENTAAVPQIHHQPLQTIPQPGQ